MQAGLSLHSFSWGMGAGLAAIFIDRAPEGAGKVVKGVRSSWADLRFGSCVCLAPDYSSEGGYRSTCFAASSFLHSIISHTSHI